jgi:hypothetical protein
MFWRNILSPSSGLKWGVGKWIVYTMVRRTGIGGNWPTRVKE